MVSSISLTKHQIGLIEGPLNAHTFLEGPAGSGKTTAGIERLLFLMEQGVRADSILLLVPQRTLAAPYYQALRHPGVLAGGTVSVVTIGGLARRAVDLFWPLVAEGAGFAHPDRPPGFLTLETAQYFMTRLVQPLLAAGTFDSLVIDRNRLYSQIIDNLNKSAMFDFPHTQIGERLQAAAMESGQARLYADAQSCASLFRQYCLAHNLLDFSLQLEVFWRHLWPEPIARDYLMHTYDHLIVDNLEENPPLVHRLLAEWLPHCTSALLICDQEAGYRYFLGADPQGAYHLKQVCPDQITFTGSFVTSPELEILNAHLWQAISPAADGSQARQPKPPTGQADLPDNPALPLSYTVQRFYPEMLDWVAGQIARLVHDEGVPAGEIVVLAPFLGDALRFSLTERLDGLQVPVRSHRPSRALREEPVTQCLLLLAALGHPEWDLGTNPFDLAYALVQAIEGLDLVRAQLLAQIVHRPQPGQLGLSSFDQIRPEMQSRITFSLGERYERLRIWLAEYLQRQPEELDYFLSRLFGELLSQPGYRFHQDYAAGEITANLIESIQKFRWVAGESLAAADTPLGAEYIQMVRAGVIAAQYIRSWELQPDEAVLLAPAYTFLMSNRPVDYQFWLDVGGRGWSERIYQPLTHPYVLRTDWPLGRVWTEEMELQASIDTLQRLIVGLVRRCRQRIFLGLSQLNEQGYEGRGLLLRSIDRALRTWPGSVEVRDV